MIETPANARATRRLKVSNVPKLKYRYFLPLFGFPFKGERFDVDTELHMVRMPKPFDTTKWRGFLSEDDLSKLSRCSHSLVLDVRGGGYPRPKELVSLFLLALWITRPTRACTAFRFVIDDDDVPVVPQAVRIMDIHQWLQGDVYENLSVTHLRRASRLFQSLKALSPTGGRLYTALTYAHYGCTTIRWQVAFTMYSASFETIFFPDSKNRITHKLARRAACFLEQSDERRKRVYERVSYFYDVRSAILHGRFLANLEDQSASKKNLKDLRLLSVTLRRVWQKILSDNKLISTLNADVTTRNTYFDKLCGAFTPN